jgi:transcription initiation factor TFIID subunit 10
LDSLESFTPIIPDEVISYYLQHTGFKTSDKRVLRLVSLSAQKFISEVCQDSFEYCKRRQQSGISKSKEKRYVLNNEDLSNSLAEYGITVRKPEYFSDSLTIETVKRTRETSGASSSNK